MIDMADAVRGSVFEGGFQGGEPPLMAGLQLTRAVQEGEQGAGQRLPERDDRAAIPGGFEEMLVHRFVTEESPGPGQFAAGVDHGEGGPHREPAELAYSSCRVPSEGPV